MHRLFIEHENGDYGRVSDRLESRVDDGVNATELPEDDLKVNGITEEDPWTTFAEERPGWKGCIEWEECLEEKAKAAAILAKHTFPPPPEF